MRLCCLFVTRFFWLSSLGNSKAKEREMPESLGLRLSPGLKFANWREGQNVAVYRYESLGGGVGATQIWMASPAPSPPVAPPFDIVWAVGLSHTPFLSTGCPPSCTRSCFATFVDNQQFYPWHKSDPRPEKLSRPWSWRDPQHPASTAQTIFGARKDEMR